MAVLPLLVRESLVVGPVAELAAEQWQRLRFATPLPRRAIGLPVHPVLVLAGLVPLVAAAALAEQQARPVLVRRVAQGRVAQGRVVEQLAVRLVELVVGPAAVVAEVLQVQVRKVPPLLLPFVLQLQPRRLRPPVLL